MTKPRVGEGTHICTKCERRVICTSETETADVAVARLIDPQGEDE